MGVLLQKKMDAVGVFNVIKERYSVGSTFTLKGKLTLNCGVLTKALDGYHCTNNECECRVQNNMACVNGWEEECAQHIVADFFEWAVPTFGKKEVEQNCITADVDETGALFVTMNSPTRR